MRSWHGTKGLLRRPLVALAALAVAGMLAAGCGGNGSGGGGIYGGGGGPASTVGGHTGVATVTAASTRLRMVLVDGSGRTLYLFEKDQPDQSACAGACAAAWPVDNSNGTPKAGSGVKASLLGTIRRGDNTTQVTYNHHPLYYYSGDSGVGQQNGQGLTPSARPGSWSPRPGARSAEMPTLDQASRASAATVPVHRGVLARSTIISWTLRVGAAAALGIDAAVHWQNASAYDAVAATVSQGQLFRVEAALAVVVGLLVLVRPQPSSWLAALAVAASALGAVLLYRYMDVGALGPLPDMYENTWHVPGKPLSAAAEAAAVVLAALGLYIHRKHPGRNG